MKEDSYEAITIDIKRPVSFYRQRVASSIRNNDTPHVVLDFSYNHLQAEVAYNQLAIQIGNIISVNRMSPDPFQIHMCGFNPAESELNQILSRKLSIDENMVFDTPKSYLDLYPREKLVYLTRDSNRTMRAFDPNKVYIIGALADTKNPASKLASYAQAKKNNIAAEALPLDQYIG